MGFNSVYKFLVEIFPQVDTRLLKAVAIEHEKDADAAAEVVLTDILPFWTENPVTPASTSVDRDQSTSVVVTPVSPSVNQRASTVASSDPTVICPSDEDLGAEQEQQSSLCRRRRTTVSDDMGRGSAVGSVAITSGHASTEVENACNSLGSSMILNSLEATSTDPHFNDANSNKLSENNIIEELILLGNRESSEMENAISRDDNRIADLAEATIVPRHNETISLNNMNYISDGPDLTQYVSSTAVVPEYGNLGGYSKSSDVFMESGNFEGGNSSGKSHSDCFLGEAEKYQEQEANLESNNPVEGGMGNSNVACEEVVPDAVDSESTIDAVEFRSGQVCRIGFLEEMIEDAKNNKKTLFSATESVMNLMIEVAHYEIAAEETQAEAITGGQDILNKVNELKEMLSHAKQANDMHAGEIYGEKSILATEAKELETRLLHLSEERDKSLAVLDEMRVSLEERLAAAVDARKLAELEKLKKEESARELLVEQETLMAKVVQEAKLLQQEAEENSRLRDFLMDRGQVVDSLQGEISVICQDVRLLKQKFDDRVPLSRSVTSSQTTCILASSGSSMRSSIASLAGEQALASSGSSKKSSIASLIGEQVLSAEEKASPTPSRVESPRVEALRTNAGSIGSEEDGWEICGGEAELYRDANATM